MAYQQKTWADRQTEFPTRRLLTATSTTDVYDVSREEGTVVNEGDKFDADNMNDLEARIAGSIGGTSVSFTLTASGWAGTAVPYTQTVAISGLTVNSNGYTGLANGATVAQFTAFDKGKINANTQAAGQLTFWARGTKPTIDLPMTIVLLG